MPRQKTHSPVTKHSGKFWNCQALYLRSKEKIAARGRKYELPQGLAVQLIAGFLKHTLPSLGVGKRRCIR
jgi:hypothetical protein